MSSLDYFGDHFIVHLDGPKFTPQDSDLLNTLKPAGIFLDGENFRHDLPYREWLAQLKDLISEAHECSGRERLIVSLDHEEGRVIRTPEPITKLPDAASYAAHAREVAGLVAEELSSIGINVLFGPVADIDSNPDNPVIGRRAYGKTPREVISAIVPYAEELMKRGILACGKHFPGHGDTCQDSHEELPSLGVNYETLKERELLPFQALVDVGIPFIMTAHVLFKEIDANLPATLSHRILTGLLRTEMGFEGIIISDDIDMKGISGNFSEEQIAKNAIIAGCDMFLFNHKPGRAIRFAKHLAGALDGGAISEQLFRSSQARINNVLNNRLRKGDVSELSEELFRRHSEIIGSLMKR